MTLVTLPPFDTVRWLPKRKASLVRALQAGLLTIDEACARYSLSIDELAGWQRELARDGRAAFAYRAFKPTETSDPSDTRGGPRRVVMRRVFFSPDPEVPSREPPPLGPDDLESMIQDTVAMLADIDAVYDARRREVAETPLPVPRRTTLLTQLAARYRKDREPHVQLLAELHGAL